MGDGEETGDGAMIPYMRRETDWTRAAKKISDTLSLLKRLGLLNYWLALAYGARDRPGCRGPHPMDN
jgi:hypothetical protein